MESALSEFLLFLQNSSRRYILGAQYCFTQSLKQRSRSITACWSCESARIVRTFEFWQGLYCSQEMAEAPKLPVIDLSASDRISSANSIRQVLLPLPTTITAPKLWTLPRNCFPGFDNSVHVLCKTGVHRVWLLLLGESWCWARAACPSLPREPQLLLAPFGR